MARYLASLKGDAADVEESQLVKEIKDLVAGEEVDTKAVAEKLADQTALVSSIPDKGWFYSLDRLSQVASNF